MEARVEIDAGSPSRPYMIETRTRGRGLGALFLRGEQVAHSEGVWHGANPMPRFHGSSGNWRGSARRTLLEYDAGGTPRITLLEPMLDTERTPVPPEALPGAVDALSAMMRLARQMRETGRCEGQTRIFDGRRLTRIEVSTDPSRQPMGGLPACVIESQMVAGVPLERPEDARPMRSVVQFAPPSQPDAPMLPIRMELASRRWGTVHVTLAEVRRG
jgi:hypothetical protein